MSEIPVRAQKGDADDERTPFSVAVKRLREERRLSQRQLASAAGVSLTHVNQIETGRRGRRPDLDTVLRLANGLAAEPVELLVAAGYASEELLAEQPPPGVVRSVEQDPRLTPRAKEMLLSLYQDYLGGAATPTSE